MTVSHGKYLVRLLYSSGEIDYCPELVVWRRRDCLFLSLSFGNTPTAVFVVSIFALVKTRFVSHWSCNQRRMSTAVRSFFTVNLSRSRTIEHDTMLTVCSVKLWDREWVLPFDLTLTLSAELLHDWGYLLDWSGLSRAKVRTRKCLPGIAFAAKTTRYVCSSQLSSDLHPEWSAG